MPLSSDGCGNSDETIVKPEIIKEVCTLVFNVVERIWHGGQRKGMFPYFFLDVTCGPGWHLDAKLPGAALVVIEMLRQRPFPSSYFLIDKNQSSVDRMKEALGEMGVGGARVECGNNLKIAPEVVSRLSYRPYGLIMSDPNGVTKPGLIKSLSALPQCRYMDWLLHIPANDMNRARSVRKIPYTYDLFFEDLLEMTGKASGLIKRSPAKSTHKWYWVFMTNAPEESLGQWKKRGWHFLHSAEGRELRFEANFTKEERRRLTQLELFAEGYGS